MPKISNERESSWPDQVFRVLKKAGIRQVSYVPDAGHSRLIELCHQDRSMRAVVLTTEEEGVALGCGAWLGGERSVLLMQSSGVGNCINMLSMVQECRFPLLTLVTMRGEWGEFNPWQVPMGSATADILERSGVQVRRTESARDAAETVAAAARLAFDAYRGVAVLFGQRLVGAKDFK